MCGFFYYSEWGSGIKNPLDEFKEIIKRSLMERGNSNYNITEDYKDSRYFFTAHSLLPIFGDTNTTYPIESDHSSLLFNGQIYSIKDKAVKDTKYQNDGFALKDYLDLDGKDSFNSLLNIPLDLTGQFAFVYSNEKTKTIILARDIAGQKPLYYLKSDKTLIVSSILELLGLFSNYSNDKLIKKKAYSLPYKESKIEKLPAGGVSTFNLDNGELLISTSVYTYSKLFFQKPYYLDRRDLIKKNFLKSLEEIIPPNKKFCLALSGGYDSTNIAEGLRKLNYTPSHVFTIKNKDNLKDVEIAKKLCLKYKWPISIINPLDVSEKVEYSSIPSDPASLSIASIALHSKKYSNVILCGDGGDEISRRYRRFLYYRFPFNLLKLIHGSQFKNLWDIFSKRKSDSRLNIYSLIAIGKNNDNLRKYKKYKDKFELIDSSMIYELIYNLPERLLSKTDIISYSYGVEFRSPYLTPRIYSFALDLNSKKQNYNISEELAKILDNKFPLKNKKLGLA